MNSNRPFCEVCGSSERPLRCAQCKKVWYCNTQHQQIDWPGHRKFCQEERQRQVQLREAEENIRLQIAQPTTSSNATACLDFGSEFPDISALLDDTNIKIPEDIDLEKLLTEITSEVVVPEQQQVLPSQPPYNSFLMKGGGENCYLPTEIPPFAFERRYEDLCQTVISDMNTYGLSVIDDFLGREKGLQILSEVHRMYSAGVFTDGQVTSHSKEGRNLKAIRGDKIAWVKGSQDGYSNIGYLINQIDTVICRANKMNGNGQLGNYSIKERTKAMVACYPGSGAHYKMHVDNPNKDGRVITAIYYLNVDWDTKRSGGVLRIFRKQDDAVADIEPKFDRLLFFWSDIRNPHEVQPAHRTRYAITVWYFDANEREKARNRRRAAVVPSNPPPPYQQPQLANAFT